MEATREVPELDELLRNPQLDVRAKAAVVDGVAGDADPLVRNLLRLLVEKGRGAEIGEVAVEFERLADAEEGRLSVELTTAFELDEAEARVDRRPDPERLRPHRRGDAQRRPGPDRRHRHPGGVEARRRQRPWPAGAPRPRTRDPT